MQVDGLVARRVLYVFYMWLREWGVGEGVVAVKPTAAMRRF